MDMEIRYKPWPKTRPEIIQTRIIRSVVERKDMGDVYKNGGHWIRYITIENYAEWVDFNAVIILHEKEINA